MGNLQYDDCLLNDFFHVKQVHVLNESRYDAGLWEYSKQFVGCTSSRCECSIYIRNDRDRDDCRSVAERKEIYGVHESQEVAILQILDSIHSYLLHHTTGPALRVQPAMEFEEKSESKMQDAAASNDADDAIDATMSNINAVNNMTNLNGTRRFRTISKGCKKHCDAERSTSSRVKDRWVTSVDHPEEFSLLQFGEYYMYRSGDPSDFDAHIEVKYSNLKEELLSNEVYTISNYQWMDIYIRATKLMATEYAKRQWKAHDLGQLNQSCGVEVGAPIDLDQMLCLFIASNFETLSRRFVDDACRPKGNEPKEQMRRRHSEIAIWSHKTRQAVWVWFICYFAIL